MFRSEEISRQAVTNNGAWACCNPACRRPLHPDHVTLVTTCHIRRFCTVECVAAGHEAWMTAVWEESKVDDEPPLPAILKEP